MVANNTQAAIWERLIDPSDEDLSPEAARFLLRLDFREADQVRMEEGFSRSSSSFGDNPQTRYVFEVFPVMRHDRQSVANCSGRNPRVSRRDRVSLG